jgi:hypothetical protein
MNIKQLVMPAIILAGAACSAAHAGPVEPSDQVAASFQRLLDHEPARTTPAVPQAKVADPLRASISAVLWAEQAASVHTRAGFGQLSARLEPKN